MRNGRLRPRVPLHDCYGNFLYLISHARGVEMLDAGIATVIRDHSYGQSRVLRYQETVGATPSNSQGTMPVITVSEMQANVMRSRTARLPEWDTKGRDSKHAREMAGNPKMPPEDVVELAQQKIRMWPVVPLWNPKRIEWRGAGRPVEA